MSAADDPTSSVANSTAEKGTRREAAVAAAISVATAGVTSDPRRASAATMPIATPMSSAGNTGRQAESAQRNPRFPVEESGVFPVRAAGR